MGDGTSFQAPSKDETGLGCIETIMSSFQQHPAMPDGISEIVVRAVSRYLPEASDLSQPGDGRYVFAYTIDIENRGERTVKLLSRHWWITDGRQNVREVEGPGVVGQQPVLRPGESFRYSSWAALPTSSGWMRGVYAMLAESSEIIEVPIPAFPLSTPQSLN
jgi:ApaG protein